MSRQIVLPVQTDAAPARFLSTRLAWTILLLVWFAVHFSALFSPPLLDDADAAHANAAQHMALSGDWVTLKINGIRYLEKAPLSYWINAIDDTIFGYNGFSAHLPMALGVLAIAALAWQWGRRAFNERAAFYAALALLTGVGVFLFTRIDIPEALLSFFLGLALYAFLLGLEDRRPALFYLCWASLAIAMLAKGLIAPVFFFAAALPWLVLTGEWRRWREMRIFTGLLLFLVIAAPWHILAGLRNPDQGNPVGNHPTFGHVHGFFYFYFINEHVLRFLGKRYPHDYNKQPAWIYWVGQIAWLLPWSLFLPLVIRRAWRTRTSWLSNLRQDDDNARFRSRTIWLLSLYAAFMMLFFSISTNQEYYTFPAYLPLLMLTGAVLASFEIRAERVDASAREGTYRWLIGAHVLFAVVGLLSAVALGYGLWTSRHLPFVPDIGTLLAHRGVGDYSLSMSHLFDLTGPSFAALRLPAALAAVVLLIGPLLALQLRRRDRHFEATLSVAFTMAIFLVAAHVAFVRFAPMLSSESMAATINHVVGYPKNENPADPAAKRATLILYGDQSDGSSVLFYTRRQALLVHGRSSTMLWGSMWPDAPHVFLDDAELASIWGTGERKFLFAEGERRDQVQAVLGNRLIAIQELADKTLYTDRPL
ncbi:MAG: Melittin resistance protein PqaB [Acidobacteriaceae bacterium]|nr:Melittin resistance protein PqaB [Acidobacteriaceae bacterium]